MKRGIDSQEVNLVTSRSRFNSSYVIHATGSVLVGRSLLPKLEFSTSFSGLNLALYYQFLINKSFLFFFLKSKQGYCNTTVACVVFFLFFFNHKLGTEANGR